MSKVTLIVSVTLLIATLALLLTLLAIKDLSFGPMGLIIEPRGTPEFTILGVDRYLCNSQKGEAGRSFHCQLKTEGEPMVVAPAKAK